MRKKKFKIAFKFINKKKQELNHHLSRFKMILPKSGVKFITQRKKKTSIIKF